MVSPPPQDPAQHPHESLSQHEEKKAGRSGVVGFPGAEVLVGPVVFCFSRYERKDEAMGSTPLADDERGEVRAGRLP